MKSETVGMDSESLLFAKRQEYKNEISNLISCRQYNDRHKITSALCNTIWERPAAVIIGKICALTVLLYINYKNDKTIGRVKYALI